MDPLSLSIACAYLLDRVVGDPRWLPHPVRGLGWAIQKGEGLSRAWIRDELWAGRFLVTAVVLGTWLAVEGLLAAAGWISEGAVWGVAAALLFFCFSTKDLAVETLPVYRELEAGRLPEARRKLHWLVGRDTDSLEEPEVVRATLETVAESAMDGIIAPLFYAAIGGAGLACLYKAVNTLDSMVGYRSARYLRFGRAAARLDTWMNWIPARLTAWLIAAAAGLSGFSGPASRRALFEDPAVQAENSYLPEAAMAGALGVRLGGVNLYQGKPVQTPWLGSGGGALTRELIPQSLRIMGICSWLGLAAALAARAAVLWIVGP